MSRITNVPIVDLRKYKTAEELRAIEIISDCAVVIFPKECSDEISAAMHSINISDVSTIAYLGEKEIYKAFNGTVMLTEKDFDPEGLTTIVINGVCIISEKANKCNGNIICNGVLLADSADSNLNFLTINGARHFLHIENYLSYENKIVITNRLIEYLKPNTAIVAANKIIFDFDITVDKLKNSTAKFLAGNKIICSKNLYEYLSVNSYFGNKIVVDDDICRDH